MGDWQEQLSAPCDHSRPDDDPLRRRLKLRTLSLCESPSPIPNPGPMQLTLERPDYDFFLRGADGASALVNERKLERSFVISPRALVEDWPVAAVAAMAPADLQPLCELEPELHLLGSGETHAFHPADTLAALLSQGPGLEPLTTHSAARPNIGPASAVAGGVPH